ncbi:MAG: DUF4838 domain-containing protein [Clostridiales bacterium]|nr:DUF4838 domain-containing protein [Clostridiales bacterium]
MKKFSAGLLALVISLSLMQTIFALNSDIVLDNTVKVLIPESPTKYELYAADKLISALSAVFGTEIARTNSASENFIAIGSASSADVSDIKVNGYRIQSIDGSVHISGTGVRGLQAGVNRFLEEFCNRKVYTSKITVLPKAENIIIPADTDIIYEPYFEYTDTDWKSPRDVEYSLANGLNGGTYRSLPAEAGGTVDYIGGFCHTMGALCETEAHAESNPEQLALFNGKRTADQPCLTNPDVVEIAKKNVLNIISQRHDPNASLQIVSVTQNDNQHYCECESCKKFERDHGGVQSATMINFANLIADAVKEAGYENVAIDTFAYQYTRQAPTGIKPRDNVIVRLCTIECCFSHTLDDKACQRNVALMKDLSDWSKICDRIYIWDYTTNYANTCLVFPDFNVIQRNIQIFYENNVKGVYEEGNYYIDNCDTEFGELRAYMISKCLQNPYCDISEETDGFLAAYYGPGWKSIKEILQIHIDNAGNSLGGHLSIGESPRESFRFTNKQINIIERCWQKAKESTDNIDYLENINRTELSWRFWKGSCGKKEFSILNPGRFDERQKLFDDFKKYGVNMISEGSYGDYLDCACVRYVPVNEWNMYEADERNTQIKLFFGSLIEKLTPILSLWGLYYKISA